MHKIFRIKICFLLLLIPFLSKSQCFEITSILVDGCDGGNEGQNEMVGLKIGATPLSVATLTVNWPNNSYLGICQSTLTTAKIAAINSSIVACGYLKEPMGGILPANSRVLLITSENFNPSAQSFVNLSDTLFVITQCAGNTAGHFANYTSITTPSVALRTLTMMFSVPGCTDAVTYSRNQLLNGAQVPGPGDGGAVLYDAVGTPTYINNGCTAPFIPLTISAAISNTTCVGMPQNITSTVTGGLYNGISWAGGTGTFAVVSSTNTSNTYTPGAGDAGVISLTATVTRSCTASNLSASTVFTMQIIPTATLAFSNPTVNVCSGQTGILSPITNATNFLWNTGATTPTLSVSPSVNTVYSFTASNACSSASGSVAVNVIPTITLSVSSSTNIVCSGNQATLTSNSSAGTYSWNNGTQTNSISVTPTVSTTYTVLSYNSCFTVSALQTISVITVPTITLNSNLFNSCLSQTTSIIANSQPGNSFTWNPTGVNTNSIAVSPSVTSVYSVSVSNSCFASSTSATVNVIPNVTLTVSSNTNIMCEGNQATLTANSSAGTYSWSTTSQANSIGVSPSVTTTYSVISSNVCSTVSAVQTISVISNPTVSITSTPTLICSGETATLVSSADPAAFNLSWSGPAITGSVNNGAGVVIASGGQYSLTASDLTTGCKGSAILNVLNSVVTASFTASALIGPAPSTINFINLSTGANTFTWNFANGAASNQVNPANLFNTPGIYVVSLTSGIDGNCARTYSLEIKIEDGLGIVPELITPNGDGKNDFFEIKGLDNYPNNSLQIYNRWGNSVYTSKPYKNNWDGAPNSAGKTGSGRLPSGTYFFLLELGDEANTQFKGFVQVVY